MHLRFIFLILALSVLFGGAQAFADDEVEFTLDKAMGDLDSVNITVLLGREAIAQAVEFAKQQRVGLLPNVSFTLQQQRTQTASAASTGVTQGGTANRFDERLNLTSNIINPNSIAVYKSARLGVKVAELDYKSTLQFALVSVSQTYFTHLRNLKRVEVIESNIVRAQALLELAQHQFDAGIATQIDITRAEAQLALAEQTRLQQETVVYQSELQFKRLLDIKTDQKIKLADFSVRQTGGQTFQPAIMQEVFDRRYDYVRQRKALEQSQEDRTAAKYERLPVLSAFGNYGHVLPDFMDGPYKKGWGAGLAINVPVFDGLKAGADIRAANSRLRSQQFRVHNMELQLTAEVRLALQDSNSRFAQIAIAQKSYDLGVEELRLARLRFEQGVADNREIIDAENKLDLAADNLVEAVYQYNLSRLELARSRGDVRDILNEKAG